MKKRTKFSRLQIFYLGLDCSPVRSKSPLAAVAVSLAGRTSNGVRKFQIRPPPLLNKSGGGEFVIMITKITRPGLVDFCFTFEDKIFNMVQ